MFPMVARSASERADTPSPKYSTNLPTTPVLRSISVTVNTRSVAVAPSGSEPLSGSRLVDSFVQLRTTGVPVGTVDRLEVIDPEGRRPLSLSDARDAQTFRLTRGGFYQIRFANRHDTVVGANPDRRESNLESLPNDLQQLWSGSSGDNVPQKASARSGETKTQLSLWWYVMLVALAAASAEIAVASRYIGTQREET